MQQICLSGTKKHGITRITKQIQLLTAMTKYKEYFQNMLAQNKKLFDEFRAIHDTYAQAQDTEPLQESLNEVGEKVLEVIREWEDKLCNRSEGSGYAAFTGNLAEKFQQEIRREFPMIDHVGIVTFSLKKISPQ